MEVNYKNFIISIEKVFKNFFLVLNRNSNQEPSIVVK